MSKRTPVISLEGKTITKVTLSPKGDYVFWDSSGNVIMSCAKTRCFDSEGYYFGDKGITISTVDENGLHKL